MADLQSEGLPGGLLLHNKNIAMDAVEISADDARSVRTMTDLKDRISRKFLYYGQPMTVKKRAWQLKLNQGLSQEEYEHILWIDALPGEFDFSLWTYDTELFAWPADETLLPLVGGHRMLKAWRRDALSEALIDPPDITVATQFPAKAVVDGTVSTLTFGTVDEKGHQYWYPSTSPTACVDTNLPNVQLTRIPLYRVYVDHLASSASQTPNIDRTLIVRES
jgi:hypothetical protein